MIRGVNHDSITSGMGHLLGGAVMQCRLNISFNWNPIPNTRLSSVLYAHCTASPAIEAVLPAPHRLSIRTRHMST
jgi:hypothetical protein